MKDTLIEIKNNLHERDEAGNQSNVWNIERKKQPIRTRRRKKNKKKVRIV